MTGGLDPDEFFDLFLADATPSVRGRAVIDGPVAQWRRWWRARPCDDPIVAAAARHGFVLRTSDLDALGVSRAQMRTRTRNGRWTSAGRGSVAPIDIHRDPPEFGNVTAALARRRHSLVSAASILWRPDDAVSGRSAAILHGLPTYAVPAQPEITARGFVGLGRRPASHLYGATLDAHEITTWFGVDVATVARTLVDVARHDRWDGIMAGDAALRERLVTRGAIEQALQLARQWPGIRQARDVLRLADPRAESPLESLTRLRLHDDGFPPPELQKVIGADRVDLYWDEYGLVLEADGRSKYTDDALWREKQREQRLRRHVKRIERVVWSDVTTDWAATRVRLRSAFR